MVNTSKKLGKRIQELRKVRGLTQSQLAELIDVEVVTISRIENGTRFPQKENLENIAKALDVEIKDLFDFEKKSSLSKTALLKDIQSILKKSKVEDLQFFYKMMKNYFDAKQ